MGWDRAGVSTVSRPGGLFGSFGPSWTRIVPRSARLAGYDAIVCLPVFERGVAICLLPAYCLRQHSGESRFRSICKVKQSLTTTPGDFAVPRLCRFFPPTVVIAVLLFGSPVWAQSAVAPGARVAIIGDSITEQKLYSNYVECYLLACSGVPDVKVMQYGWGGERADGFANRAENDLAGFQPTVATLCYGMNDGGYQPWKDEIGVVYERNMRNVLARLDAVGVKTIVVGSPGAVDTDFFRPGQKMGDRPAHEAYNDTLAHLRDIDKRLAAESKQRFADVHAAMFDSMK